MNRDFPDNIKEISLAIIDSFYELFSKKSNFLDLDLFEIQLLKYGIDLDKNTTDFFNSFLSKDKKQEEIDFFSQILSHGIKNKYKYFNEKLENLKSLYEVIIWIETHTEFTTLKYIDEVFHQGIEQFYKFILFYIFKKEEINEINDFSTKNIEDFILNTKNNNNFAILELIFQYFKRTDLVIKNFLSFSKDKDYFKFIIIQKKLSSNEVIKDIILNCETEDYIHFLLYLITFNPYIIIDDFKIDFFKKDIRNYYLFLKAILYRFQYYKVNQRSPYELIFFFKYIFKKESLNEIDELLHRIIPEDIILFEPFILFSLNYENNEFPILTLFKTIKAQISNNDFIINYNLLYSIIEKIIEKKIENMTFSIFLGNFKKYLKSNEKFKENELKNFFMTINLFLIKTKLNLENKEKLFKMNLKFFEKYIKNIKILNPILLAISKHYGLILNKYLKEYDKNKDIELFIKEIKNIIYNGNKLIILKAKSSNEIDPNEISFSFISNEIKNELIKNFNSNNNKITIYTVQETEGFFISKKFFNTLIFLKLILFYDLFYPIFNKLSPKKIKIKKDNKKIYILSKENILLNKFNIENFNAKPKNFYYHFVNKIYSIIIISISSLIGFRIIIDAIIVKDNNLLIFGISIIILSLLIDYFLFFFFKKFDKLYFFDVKINNDNKIFYSTDEALLNIINKEST